MKFNFEAKTNGKGYWSSEARTVALTHLELEPHGELRAYFDTKTWNTQAHGLIYSDKQFIAEFRSLLKAQGLTWDDVNYSEMGMQGRDFVSFDVGKAFIESWKAAQARARASTREGM